MVEVDDIGFGKGNKDSTLVVGIESNCICKLGLDRVFIIVTCPGCLGVRLCGIADKNMCAWVLMDLKLQDLGVM